MPLGRPKVALLLTDDERVRLDSLAHRSRTAPHLARRARIILTCAEGLDSTVVAKRLYLRGHTNIRKRALIHTAALNLGLLMRTLFGVGTPRSLQGRVAASLYCVWALIRLPETLWTMCRPSTSLGDLSHIARRVPPTSPVETAFTTGC